MMQAVVVTAHNPFDFADRRIETIDHPVRLVDLVPPSVPAILCLNGEWRLRETWHECLRDGDHALVAVLPQGERDLNNLKAAATVAAIYFTAGAAGIAFGSGAAWSAVAGGALGSGALTLGLSALAGDPTRPGGGSPTYDQNASGNYARVNQEIPEHFGRLEFYPDIAADAYVEPVGSANWFNQLFCLGQGEYEIADADIKLGDEPLSSITGLQKEIVAPGGLVTLFPRRVDTSTQVTEGAPQVLTYNTWIGPYAASPAGATILPNRVALDVVFWNGLTTDDGTEQGANATVTLVAEARPIDAAGAPVPPGTYTQIGTKTITANTRAAYRDMLDCTLAPAGRYEVRMQRTSAPIGSYDEAYWTGMRAYTPHPDTYGNVTMLAVRMPAQTQIQARAVNRLNLIATRKLPSWSAGGGWTANASTRSIAAAISQILRSSNGLALPDARIDLAALWALDATWTTRGDKFDFRFDSAVTPWDAVQAAARCGRAKAYLQGGVVRFARDELKTVPAAMFTPRNLLPDSLKLNYNFPTSDAPDSVIVEYFNEATWAWDEVLCQLVGETADRPARVKIQGISQHDHAWREGMFLTACMRYRRRQGELATEMEGFIPSCLDLIAVAHDRPRWGQAGEVTAWNAGTKTLTLSEPATFVPSVTHYVALRKRDGSLSGPYVATAGASAQQIVLDTVPGIPIDTDLTRERTHFAFGPSDAYRQRLLCLSIQPIDSEHARLQIVVEDDRVHSADGTTPPVPVDPWTLPRPPAMPEVTGLRVTQGGTPAQPVLFASWTPAAGADHYLVEISRDGGLTYRRIGGEPTTAHADSLNVTPGPFHLRVAGVGIMQGPWCTPFSGTAGVVAAPPAVTGLALAEAFTGPVCRIKFNLAPRGTDYTVKVYDTGTMTVRRTRTIADGLFEYSAADAKQDGGPWRALTFGVVANNLGGSSGEVQLAVSNPQAGAVSNVVLAGSIAGIVVKFDPPSGMTDGKGYRVHLASTPSFTPDFTNLIADGPDTFYHIQRAPSLTHYVKIAAYDVWGTDSLTYSTEDSVNLLGITAAHLTSGLNGIQIVSSLPADDTNGKVAFLTTDGKMYRWVAGAWTKAADGGDLIADSVTADAISVATLAAIVAELGSAVISTSGSLRSGKTSFSDTAAGFWQGIDAGLAKYIFGNADEYVSFDGSRLKQRLRGLTIDLADVVMAMLVETWTERTNPKNISLGSIVWNGATFVAVGGADGADAYILTSPDGITWTERANPKNVTLNGVAWNGSVFAAVGFLDGVTDAYLITSPDGITWTERANPKNFTLAAIAWNGSVFVAVGNADGTDAYIITSPDGTTWTERANPKNVNLNGVAWNGSILVAVGNADGTDAYIITSSDGITWTECANPKNFALASAAWNGSLFAAVGVLDGTDAYIVTSPDGTTWTERANPKNFTLVEIAWNGLIFVAVGLADGTDAYLLTSRDGILWTERANPKNIGLQHLAWNGSIFVAVGNADGTDAYLITSVYL